MVRKGTDPTVDTATHKGWLQKAGHVNPDFKRRFFMLSGAKLSYFESLQTANKGKAKGTITVTKVNHVSADHEFPSLTADKVTLAFQFDTAEKKSFVVYADSLKEKLAWLRALSDAITPQGSAQHTAIEDAFREQIRAAVLEEAASSDGEQSSWVLVGEGIRLVREGDPLAARKRFEDALVRADYVDRVDTLNPPCLAALYELGKLMCETGKYADALKYFELAALMAPVESRQQLRLQQAWCTWRLNKVGEAAQLYRSILEQDALCWQALLDRSRMHLATGRWEDGHVDLSLVIAMGQLSPEIYNDRGVCHYELGMRARRRRSAPALSSWAPMRPEDAPRVCPTATPPANRATAVTAEPRRPAEAARVRRHRFEQAIADFNEALQMNESYCQAFTNRGNCLRKQGLNKEAMEDYGKAISHDGQNPKAFNNRGALALKMGKYADALTDFETAVALDPDYNVAKKNLEVAKQRRDDVQGSIEARADMITQNAHARQRGQR